MSSVVLVGLRTSSRFCTLRKLSTSSFQIFDRRAKRLQRARAARRENATVYDYLRDEVAFRLADRILDIKRTFEVAVDLGCGRGHLAQHLTSDAVSFLYQCDSCLDILKQAKPSPDVETMSLNIDEESLPFQENSINLFLSCLGLHWINDLRGTFSQVLRCLKPDGCFLGVTYGMDTLFELRVALQLAEMERLGGFYPHVSPFIDSARLGDLLQEAGFNLITLDVDELIIHYPSMFELMEDLRGMGESNAVVSRPLRLNRDVVSAAAAIYDDIRRLMIKQWLSLWLRRLRQPAGCRSAWPSGLSTRTFECTTAFHRRGFSYVTTLGTAFAFALFWPFSRREPSLEERIKEQMHDAFLHIKNNRLEDADTALHALLLTLDEATRTGQLTIDAWLSRRARVYSELANLKLLQKDYPAAERLFVHTIRDCTASGVPPGSPMIIELSLKLAMVYSRLADSEKAESGFAFCLMMQRQNCSAIPLDDDGKPLSEEDVNNLALLGAVQNAYAHYEVLAGRLSAGRKLLEAALKTARRVYAPNHLNCVHLLADLANVESQLDMPKNARSRLKEAVSLVLSATPASKREKQESDVALFNLYCQWAVLEGNQGAFKTAKKYLTEAKLLSANLPGDTDSQRRYSKQISKVETMLQRWQGMEANCEELLVPNNEA